MKTGRADARPVLRQASDLELEFGDSENPMANLREELVQVAAVAVAWIECLDREGRVTS